MAIWTLHYQIRLRSKNCFQRLGLCSVRRYFTLVITQVKLHFFGVLKDSQVVWVCSGCVDTERYLPWD